MEVSPTHSVVIHRLAHRRQQIQVIAARLNAGSTRYHPQLTLPNILTGSRFLVAPLLLYLAWFDHPGWYIVVLSGSFFTDLIDGMIARLLNLESALGAALDTWSDFFIYVTIPITAWWLWPQLVARELPYVIVIILGYLVPALIGTIKFHQIPSYHTWGAKLAAASVGSSMLLMVVAGPVWPFHLATLVALAAALEEIAVTVVLVKPCADVRTLWHVLASRN